MVFPTKMIKNYDEFQGLTHWKPSTLQWRHMACWKIHHLLMIFPATSSNQWDVHGISQPDQPAIFDDLTVSNFRRYRSLGVQTPESWRPRLPRGSQHRPAGCAGRRPDTGLGQGQGERSTSQKMGRWTQNSWDIMGSAISKTRWNWGELRFNVVQQAVYQSWS